MDTTKLVTAIEKFQAIRAGRKELTESMDRAHGAWSHASKTLLACPEEDMPRTRALVKDLRLQVDDLNDKHEAATAAFCKARNEMNQAYMDLVDGDER